MFADLVGSTALSHDLDAEDFRDLIKEYWQLCGEAISELGGHVQQHLGDGVMAYFGHPRAHEDDPRRATEAALRILHRLGSLHARLLLSVPLTLQARIGIHTGITVVGHEGVALGKTPNLAARLEQLAEPNSVVISGAVKKLIEGYFHFEDLGPQTVKGLAEPIMVHRVVGSTGAQSRVAAVGPRLTPLVGRESELNALNSAWDDVVKEGHLRVLTLRGDAGIGKTRLAQVLKQYVAHGSTVIEGYCSPLHENAALRPLAQALEKTCAIDAHEEPQQRLAKLADYLGALGLDLQTIALLALVLSLPIPEAGLTALAPPIKRQRTMLAFGQWLSALAKSRPLLLLIEDVHWADPSTLEFLQLHMGALNAAVKGYDSSMLVSLPRDYGYDNALWGHLYLTWALHAAGKLGEAQVVWEELWSIVEEARSPYLTVMALSFGAVVAREVGNYEQARALAEQGVALAAEHQLAFWLALARLQLGSALCMGSDEEEGSALIEQGLAFCRAIGVMTPLTYYLAYLGDAHWRAGRIRQGLEVVAEGLVLADARLDRTGLVELLRLKGNLLAATDWVQSATCFEQSLVVAREQGARLGELCTATSYATHLRAHGNDELAHALLNSALGFVGGAEPPVVKTARALLQSITEFSSLGAPI